jgi:hypothetical protein
MKITHVRARKLVSGPGFSNVAAELEAALENGDDASAVYADLLLQCQALARGQSIARLREEEAELRWSIDQMRRQKPGLVAEVEALRKELRDAGDALARARDEADGQNAMPFPGAPS